MINRSRRIPSAWLFFGLTLMDCVANQHAPDDRLAQAIQSADTAALVAIVREESDDGRANELIPIIFGQFVTTPDSVQDVVLEALAASCVSDVFNELAEFSLNSGGVEARRILVKLVVFLRLSPKCLTNEFELQRSVVDVLQAELSDNTPARGTKWRLHDGTERPTYAFMAGAGISMLVTNEGLAKTCIRPGERTLVDSICFRKWWSTYREHANWSHALRSFIVSTDP